MGKSKIEWTDTVKRFWSYVEIKSPLDCWEWTGGLFTNRYGQFRSGSKKVKAHRHAFKLFYGKIPKDKIVMHKCDNPKCVNPLHLQLGTHKENAMDREVKGRGAYNLQPQPGEKNGSAKLKKEEVILICGLRRSGHTYKELAKYFGISPSQIANIVKNRSWKGTTAACLPDKEACYG